MNESNLEKVTALWSLADDLNEDVVNAATVLKEQGTPFHRRQYVRAVFAQIEAIVYLIKQELLERPCILSNYSAAEMALLREETYSLNGRYEATTQPKFIPLDQNFRFVMMMHLRGRSTDFQLDFGDGGWAAFRQAIQIRHRITHPKEKALLSITDEEIKVVKQGYAWFCKTYYNAQNAVLKYLEAAVDELKKSR